MIAPSFPEQWTLFPCPFSKDTHVQDKDIRRIFIRTAKNRGCELQQRELVYLQ